MGIKPVNWCTNATLTALHDGITVTLSPQYHVLVVSGYSGSEYPAYKGFLNVGDILFVVPLVEVAIILELPVISNATARLTYSYFHTYAIRK